MEDIKVGDRVYYIARVDGILLRRSGIVVKILPNNYAVKVDRATPLTENHERLGPDCPYSPPVRYSPKKSWCKREAESV